MIRPALHLVLHVVVPLAVAFLAARPAWRRAFVVMIATMAVDLDHLLADPLYNPNRCSLTAHPLHEPLLFPVWAALALWPQTRWVGVGLLIHMALDGIDCALMA